MPETAAKAPTLWLPKRTRAMTVRAKASIGLIGPSGSGKSHGARQLAMDPEYAGKVLVAMSEDATSTYGEDILSSGALHIAQIRDAEDAKDLLKEIVEAEKAGKSEFKVIYFDSMSGTGDHEMFRLERNPELWISDEGKKNAYAKFGKFGLIFKELQVLARDYVRADVILTATTTFPKPGVPPELCIDGRMVPENFTRLTNVTLYLDAKQMRIWSAGEEPSKDQVEQIKSLKDQSHIEIGRDENGKVDGSYIVRHVTSKYTGEVAAKGHRSLFLRERADIPMILRKIHGETK